MSEGEVAEALRRNDRYLAEFVEAHDVCPFARRCRETGALLRRVVLDEAAALDAVRELAAPEFARVEVALLVFPRVARSPLDWEHFVTDLRDARAREEPTPTFFLVAFHPDSPATSDTPERTVSLLRRTPDPTIQLVRASLLARIRGNDPSDTVFADPATFDFDAPARRPARSLSEQIARANHETVRRLGAEALVALLGSFRRPAGG